MNIMVIGSGGRESAVIRKLRENPSAEKLYALPGNAGIARMAECVPISATDVFAAVEFAKSHEIDYAVVTPDDPLCLGLVDMLEEAGIPAFGPSKAAARIEGSKAFAKNLMKKYGIPTAAFETFDDYDAAREYLLTLKPPYVIKADGLALGKGVTIAETLADAEAALADCLLSRKFGDSGKQVVIEEYLTGVEASLLLFSDGETYRLMPAAMDHKRALDGDKGGNTGGMGSIAPNPCVTPALLSEIERTIVAPTLAAMRSEGCPFKGCLFIGLMLTDDGAKVIEYNARLGDPETQSILALLESDLLSAMLAATDGTLSSADVRFRDKRACCVVLASGGYPASYEKGMKITVPDVLPSNVKLDFAGVSFDADGSYITSGGRVIGVTA
ncbi:MAG: phosphoribosylamine--glycine ligase, partial [Oscillospiraceae bacterium]|nr:phosphoribosylamine--glycine ligase [Oscillospiraceae bacterium]